MSEYTERDIMEQGEHYSRHVNAMTAEGLHSKSDIAAELAWRDMQIAQLKQRELELMAHVERLKVACQYYSVALNAFGAFCSVADEIVEELPNYALAGHDAEVIEKTTRDVREQIPANNEFGSVDACYTYKLIEYADQLRQQAGK